MTFDLSVFDLLAVDLSGYSPDDPERGHQRRMLSVHVSGGKSIDLTMDVSGLEEVGERMRRERALIGQMTFSDDHGEHVRDVLIPSSRIDFVVDAND